MKHRRRSRGSSMGTPTWIAHGIFSPTGQLRRTSPELAASCERPRPVFPSSRQAQGLCLSFLGCGAPAHKCPTGEASGRARGRHTGVGALPISCPPARPRVSASRSSGLGAWGGARAGAHHPRCPRGRPLPAQLRVQLPGPSAWRVPAFRGLDCEGPSSGWGREEDADPATRS